MFARAQIILLKAKAPAIKQALLSPLIPVNIQGILVHTTAHGAGGGSSPHAPRQFRNRFYNGRRDFTVFARHDYYNLNSNNKMLSKPAA